MSKNKVNTIKYKTLKCRHCSRNKSIKEKKNPGFNYWHPGGYIYLIVCDDNFLRSCEVGAEKPTDCLIDEENWEEWEKNGK